MLFKVEVRYSSLVGQILVLNCRHQGLVFFYERRFKCEFRRSIFPNRRQYSHTC